MAEARETEPIASLATGQGAQEVAQILRANGIRCAVIGPPDGRAYHSFEAATPAVLRAHVEHHADPDAITTRQVAYLADLVEQMGQPTVYEAFREHRRLLPDRPQPVLGRTLDDWARACGCAHVHIGRPSQAEGG
jgi:hypothetical protein